MSIAFFVASPETTAALNVLRAVAALGEAAAVTGSAMLGEVCIALSAMQGDSNPKHLIADANQPLRGLSRFASAVVPDGEQSVSDASPTGPVAVGLPGEPTESTTTAADAVPQTDWLALLKQDPWSFFAQARRYLMGYKAELLRRLERGDSIAEITQWLDDEIEKNINPLAEIQREMTRHLPVEFRSIMHDLARQSMDFLSIRYSHLESGDIGAIRRYCQNNFQTLEEVVEHLTLIFGDKVQILFERTYAVNNRFRSKEDAQRLVRILENLVRNCADLPRSYGIPLVHIAFFDDGIHLAVSDTLSGFQAGMPPEVVRSLNQEGVRVHNGEAITSETEATKGHGYGWQSIRENCRALGIQWHIWSDRLAGTTVTLTLPDGFFVPL